MIRDVYLFGHAIHNLQCFILTHDIMEYKRRILWSQPPRPFLIKPYWYMYYSSKIDIDADIPWEFMQVRIKLRRQIKFHWKAEKGKRSFGILKFRLIIQVWRIGKIRANKDKKMSENDYRRSPGSRGKLEWKTFERIPGFWRCQNWMGSSTNLTFFSKQIL